MTIKIGLTKMKTLKNISPFKSHLIKTILSFFIIASFFLMALAVLSFSPLSAHASETTASEQSSETSETGIDAGTESQTETLSGETTSKPLFFETVPLFTNEPAFAAETGLQSISLRWRTATGVSSDGLSLIDSTNISSKRTLGCSLTYVYSGDSTALPGTIKISIPKDIFRDRQTGMPLSEVTGTYLEDNGSHRKTIVAQLTVPFPKKGDSGSSNWVYSEVEGFYVIENVSSILVGTRLDAEFSFMYSPVMVEDGYKNTFSVSAECPAGKIVSNNISLETDLGVTTALDVNGSLIQYSTWNPLWGKAPDDAENKNFIFYSGSSNYPESAVPLANSFDFSVSVDGIPISADVEASFVTRHPSIPERFDVSPNSLFRNLSSLRLDQYDNAYPGSVQLFPINPSVSLTYISYVIGYPKPDITTKKQVKLNMVLDSYRIDDLSTPIASKTKNHSITYQDISFVYSGDSYSLYFDNLIFHHSAKYALSALEKGSPIDVSYLISAFSRMHSQDSKQLSFAIEKMFLNDSELGYEDYSISNPFSVPTTGPYSNFRIQIIRDAPPDKNTSAQSIPIEEYQIEFRIKTRSNPEWHDYGTFTPAPGTVLDGQYWNMRTSEDNLIQFFKDWPEDVVELSFGLPDDFGRCYSFSVRGADTPYIRLNPTAHVLDIIKGQDEATLYPMAAILAENKDGSKYATRTANNVLGTKAISEALANSDQIKYGYLPYRGTENIKLSKILPAVSNYVDNYSSSISNSKQTIETRSLINIDANYGLLTQTSIDNMKRIGLAKEITYGSFYVLLPYGANLSNDTLFSYKFGSNNGKLGYEYIRQLSVQRYPNWRDSNRTMLKINVQIKDEHIGKMIFPLDQKNIQLTLDLNISYPFAAYKQYGGNIEVPVAFQSSALDCLSGTYPDNGQGFSDPDLQRLFSGLDTDSVGDPSLKNNTLYNISSQTVSANVAFEAGLQETIILGSSFPVEKERIPIGAEYAYDLTYRTASADDASSATDIIIFDRLGEPSSELGKVSGWKGTFKSLDLTQLRISQIDAVAYYSTQALDLSLDENKDLSDTSKWTTTEPADKSTIKTIAVDCRKKTDGTPFVLGPAKYMSVIVNMSASSPLSAVNKTSYNTHHVLSRLGDAGSASPLTMIQSNVTEAVLVSVPISINKTSDPVAGTALSPTIVKNGDNIDYYIQVTNSSKAAFSDVVIKDKMPTGLTVRDDITVGMTQSTAVDPLIKYHINMSVSPDGEYSFTIPEIGNFQRFFIKIPIKVSSYGTFSNVAELVSYNGLPFTKTSQAVVHKANPESYTFEFTKTGTSSIPLSGATFSMYHWVGSGTADYATDVNDTSLWVLDETAVTASDGKITFTVSSGNDCRLVETKAPDGYEIPHGDWKAKYDANTGAFTIEANGFPPAFENKNGVYSVKNYPSYLIPLAIGISPYIFVLIGTILMTTALLLQFGFKRKNKK